MKKQECKKMRRGLGTYETTLTFQHLNHGNAERKTEEQDTENLFEQIMRENFLNLVKERDFQEVQESPRVPKKSDPRRSTPIIELPKTPNNRVTQD